MKTPGINKNNSRRIISFQFMLVLFFTFHMRYCDTLPVISLSQPVYQKYYISVNGNDKNAGSYESPWRTISRSLPVVQPGDTVLVTEGVYNEMVIPRKSGEPGRNIVFKAYPGHRVILDLQYQSKQDMSYGFYFESVNHITVDGFEIINCNDNAIRTWKAAHITITRISGHHCRESGIEVMYSSNCVVEYSTFFDNGFGKPGMSGISIWKSTGPNKVRYNVCYNNIEPSEYDGNGIIVDLCFDQPTLIHHNICYDNMGAGLCIIESSNVDAYNNVFFRNGYKAPRDHESRCGISIERAGSQNRIRLLNNISMHNAFAELNVEEVAISSSHFFDYNNWYGRPDRPRSIYYGGQWLNLQEFRQKTGYGLHSLNTDPLFLDPERYNFRLQVNSPCIDAGLPVGFNYNGTAPDIGRFEH